MQQQKQNQQSFFPIFEQFFTSNINQQQQKQQQIVFQQKKQSPLNIFQNQFNQSFFINQINNNKFTNQYNYQQFNFQNNIKIQQYFTPQNTEEYIKLLKFQVYRETLIKNTNIADDFYRKKEEYLAKINNLNNQIKINEEKYYEILQTTQKNYKENLESKKKKYTEETKILQQKITTLELEIKNEQIKYKTLNKEKDNLIIKNGTLQKQTDKDKEKIEIADDLYKYFLDQKILDNKTIFEKFCNKLQKNIVDPIKTIYFLFTLHLKKEILYKNFQTKFIPLTIYVLSSGFLIHSIIKDKKISFFHKMALIIAIKYAFSCFLKMNIDPSKYFEQEEHNNKIIAFGDFINLSFASFLLFNKTLAKLLFSEEESHNYAANKKNSYGYNEFKYLYFFASIINIIAALTIAIQLPSIPIVGKFEEIIKQMEVVYKKYN